MSFLQGMQQGGQPQKKKPNVPRGQEFDEPMEQITQRMPGMAEDAALEDKVGSEKAAEMKASMQRISEMFGEQQPGMPPQAPQMPQAPGMPQQPQSDVEVQSLDDMGEQGMQQPMAPEEQGRLTEEDMRRRILEQMATRGY